MDKQKGFSFIEVLIALVLVLIGLLGMFSIYAKGLNQSFEIKRNNAALELSNDFFELVSAYRDTVFNKGFPHYSMYHELKADTPFWKDGKVVKVASKNCNPSITYAASADIQNQLSCWFKKLEKYDFDDDVQVKTDEKRNIISLTITWSARDNENLPCYSTGNNKDKCYFSVSTEI